MAQVDLWKFRHSSLKQIVHTLGAIFQVETRYPQHGIPNFRLKVKIQNKVITTMLNRKKEIVF